MDHRGDSAPLHSQRTQQERVSVSHGLNVRRPPRSRPRRAYHPCSIRKVRCDRESAYSHAQTVHSVLKQASARQGLAMRAVLILTRPRSTKPPIQGLRFQWISKRPRQLRAIAIRLTALHLLPSQTLPAMKFGLPLRRPSMVTMIFGRHRNPQRVGQMELRMVLLLVVHPVGLCH